MHFNDLKSIFPALLDSGVSIELISPPGQGKSEFVADHIRRMNTLADEKGSPRWGFSTMFLATMTPPDLIGYIFKGEREFTEGVTTAVTEPTLPLWMMTTDGRPAWEYERGILFLDEFGQGEADVKRASAELLLNRQLGPWKLPKGWTVVAASNRASDRSGVTKSFDFVINRRAEIHITPDLKSWEDWAWSNELDPTIIAFASQNPHIVFTDAVPDKQGPWCTPRSLVMLARMLDGMRTDAGHIPTHPLAVELSSGMIGEAAAAQLFATIRLGQDMPAYDDIVAKPEKVKVPDKPDAQMLISYNLAARVTEKDAGPVMAYMERMPKEMAMSFVKIAVRRQPDLLDHTAFDKWVSKNSTLMSAIVGAS